MTTIPSPASPQNQRGLSLIELMIAILISAFLLLGLIEMFAASRTAYQLSQGVARVQENGRFALGFLMRDVRMAGHMGCVNDQALSMTGGGGINAHFNSASFPLRFDIGLQGFEADDTSPGDTLTLPAAPVAGAADTWTPALPADIAALSPVAGSDIVMLRFLDPIGTSLQSFSSAATTSVATPLAAGSSVTTEGHSLFGISDCQRVSLFQASQINPTTGAVTIKDDVGLNVTPLSGLETYSGGQAVLYRAVSVAYYVALNGQGSPALYRTRWEAAPGATPLVTTTSELVEGIDTLQLLYGEDHAALADPVPTGFIDKVNDAGSMGTPLTVANDKLRWRRVGAVQVGVVARSPQSAANQGAPAEDVLGLNVTVPADSRYRYSYETTVALRNRMFGN